MSPGAHLSHSMICKELNEDDTEETLLNKQTKGIHEYSVGVLVRVHMLQVCVHVKHVVVFVALRIRVINSVVISVPTDSLFICIFTFHLYVNSYNCSLCENGSFEVLSFQQDLRADTPPLTSSQNLPPPFKI